MTNLQHVHITATTRDPKDCPKDANGKCCKCGSSELAGEYGFGGGYGLGFFTRCMSCYAVMNFVEDKT